LFFKTFFFSIDYVKEVERCRNTDNLEKSTKAFIENQKEPTNIANIMNKINKAGQPIIYYAGGLRSLATILTDSNLIKILAIILLKLYLFSSTENIISNSRWFQDSK
jgi:hypothetical protein